MPNNKLKVLINLIGDEEIFSNNVSLRNGLDENAFRELRSFQESRPSEEVTAVRGILQEVYKCPRSSADEPTNWTYAINVFEILLGICNELEYHDDFPISINEAKKVHIGIRKLIEFALKPYLLDLTTPIEHRLPYIIASSKILLKIASNKFFSLICSRTDQHLVYTDLLSSIFMIICYAGEEEKSQFSKHLNDIQSTLTHADYFKILFLIQGSVKNIPDKQIIQQTVHKQLIQLLYRSGSFIALCEALLPSITSLDQNDDIVKKRLHCCEVISTIIATRGYKKLFYNQIINEIHEHLLYFIRSDKSHQLYFFDVGIHCLSKLFSLGLSFISHHITHSIFNIFDKLGTPNEIIAGAIVCEPNEFIQAIHLVHLIFCASGPSDHTLPSACITPYLKMFIQIYHILYSSTNKELINEILAIIVRCLSNRDKSELNSIVELILFDEYDESIKCLSPRLDIQMVDNGEKENIKICIAAILVEPEDSSDIDSFVRPSISLLNVLKQCNHNILIYNIFLHLLQMFSDNFCNVHQKNGSSSSELLGSEDEMKTAIEIKFKRKYVIIHALNELILFKSFYGQLSRNPNDIFFMLDKILNQQLIQLSLKPNDMEESEEILIVILSIIEQLKPHVKNDKLLIQLEKTLKKLRNNIQNEQMRPVFKKLNDILDAQIDGTTSDFQAAKEILCEAHSEPYTKAFAMMNIVKLIDARDVETCSNSHIVLAIAMRLLKEEDSYIFLNCIKLLISLFQILKDSVLDTLIAEYHLDIDADSTDIDFKLKIGESIVKVTQGLGEMCYKYKATLIECFLRGAYNKNNEFRTSNMSNLGVIMRILSYQVHHFFQEMMVMIQNTIQYDKYLPARRAAALVLTDLLNGMKSLEQYQEFLLPIYQCLKSIMETDSDLQMQIHARNGLDGLKDKIKEALTPKSKFEKEIKIFNI